MPTLHVVAHLTAKPDKIDQTREMLVSLIAPTHAEEGCIRYELFRNNADPAQFTFIEEWTDNAALVAHLDTPHVQTAFARVPELLDGEPDIRRYTTVE